MSNAHRVAAVTRLNRGALGSSIVCGVMLVVALITGLPVAVALMVMVGIAAVVQRSAAEIIMAGRE